MSDNTNSGLFTTCSMVCWTVALVAGLFVASVCLYWLGLHGLVSAVIGLIAALALGVLLKTAICSFMESASPDPVHAAPVVAPKQEVAPEPAPEPVAEPAPAPAADTADDDAPNMYDKAPDDADDLKVISGVGPALEKTLNEMGVYKYIQIASWTASDIAWVDARLKFKGRIERDNWVQQAKDLA